MSTPVAPGDAGVTRVETDVAAQADDGLRVTRESVSVASQTDAAGNITRVSVDVAADSGAAARVTNVLLEVATPHDFAEYVTRAMLEAGTDADAPIRTSRVTGEVATDPDSGLFISRCIIEIATPYVAGEIPDADIFTTRLLTEVGTSPDEALRFSRYVLEVATPFIAGIDLRREIAGIDESLFAHVTSDPAVFSLIGTRFYAGECPQDATYPLAIYSRISSRRLPNMAGASGLVFSRYQISTLAESDAEAREVSEAIRKSVSGYLGLMQSLPVAASEADDIPDISYDDIGLFQSGFDVFLTHEEQL